MPVPPRISVGHDPTALLRALLRDANDVALVVDPEGVVVQVLRSPSVAGNTMVGRSFVQLVADAERAGVHTALRHTIDTGEPSRFEIPARTPDGLDGWFQCRTLALSGSEPPLALLLVQDTTAEHRRLVEIEAREARLAETVEALRRSEERFRTLFEHLPSPATTIGRDLKFRQLNRVSPGLTVEFMQQRSALDYVEPEHRDRVRALLDDTFETGTPHTYEIRTRHTDGTFHAYLIRAARLPLHGDDAPEALLITTEITERTQAEEALRTSEARLERATRAAGVTPWDWDLVEDRVVAVMGRDTTCTGDRARWTGQVHPDDRATFSAALDDLVAGRSERMDLEYRVRNATTGGWSWLLTRAGVDTRDADGHPLRVSGTHLDVNDRHAAEEERAALQHQLLQAQKMEVLGQLAGGLAHDFNNLLLVIQSHLSFARETLGADRRVDDDLRAIDTAAARAGELTRQLLAVARRQRFDVGPVELDPLVAEAISLLRRTLPRNVELIHQPHPTPLAVAGNAGQLHQVLMNLAVNARDAMPAGGTLRFSVRPADDPSEILLEVADSGSGMAPEVLERIFEPFFSARGSGGTGLGLAMVHGIVRQHGGRIEVSSTPGSGTTFRVFLPRTEPAAATHPGAQQTAPRGGETVLVAEDQAPVRQLVVRVLTGAGYRVLEAADGLEALRQIEAHPGGIALVLLDLMMPGLTGREVWERVSPRHPELRYLLTSGYSAGDLPEGFVSDHGLTILPKPYRPQTLLEHVRAVLDRGCG